MTQLKNVKTSQLVKHQQTFLGCHSGVFQWNKFCSLTPRLPVFSEHHYTLGKGGKDKRCTVDSE